MSKYAQTSSEHAIAEYLVLAYGVTRSKAEEVMEKNREEVQHGISFMSNAGYVADKIAATEGLVEIPDHGYDEDDDEEEDDDG